MFYWEVPNNGCVRFYTWNLSDAAACKVSFWRTPCKNVSDLLVPLHRNVIHGSDSVESAQKEIYLWFRQNELQSWKDCSSGWIYNWSANPSNLTSVSALAACSHMGENKKVFIFLLLFLQLKWDLSSQQCVSNNYLVGIIIWSSWFMFRT